MCVCAFSGEEEQTEEDDRVSNNELIRSATVFAQFPQLTFGKITCLAVVLLSPEMCLYNHFRVKGRTSLWVM